MGNALDFMMSLDDKMSGPLNAVASKINTVDAASSKMAASTTGSFGAMSDAIEHAAQSALNFGIQMAKAAASQVFDLVKAGAELAIDASSFKSSTIDAFETIVGTHEEAAAIFDKIDKLAGKLALDDHDVAAQMQKLMAS